MEQRAVERERWMVQQHRKKCRRQYWQRRGWNHVRVGRCAYCQCERYCPFDSRELCLAIPDDCIGVLHSPHPLPQLSQQDVQRGLVNEVAELEAFSRFFDRQRHRWEEMPVVERPSLAEGEQTELRSVLEYH